MLVTTHSPSLDSVCLSVTPAVPTDLHSPSPSDVASGPLSHSPSAQTVPASRSITPMLNSLSLNLLLDSHTLVATHSPLPDSFSLTATPALPVVSRLPSPSQVTPEPANCLPSTQSVPTPHSVTLMLDSLSMDMLMPVSVSQSPEPNSQFDLRTPVTTHSPSLDLISPLSTPPVPTESHSPSPSEFVSELSSCSPSTQTVPASHSIMPMLKSSVANMPNVINSHSPLHVLAAQSESPVPLMDLSHLPLIDSFSVADTAAVILSCLPLPVLAVPFELPVPLMGVLHWPSLDSFGVASTLAVIISCSSLPVPCRLTTLLGLWAAKTVYGSSDWDTPCRLCLSKCTGGRCERRMGKSGGSHRHSKLYQRPSIFSSPITSSGSTD